MKTCRDCKEIDCYRDQYADSAACEDFTSKAIKEEAEEWTPTLEDYNELKARIDDIIEDLARKIERIKSFESAVAELVRWAQDERP